MARLKERYKNEIAGELQKKFGYTSVMQIPKLEKVVLNVACGDAKDNAKVVEAIITDLGLITGQKPHLCGPPLGANFKLREGMIVGVKVMRGDRMYEFVDRPLTWRCLGCATSMASTPTVPGRPRQL